MNFSELCKIIFDELPKRLNQHIGLSVFAKERFKFEGWLKAEACDILLRKNISDVVPEKQKIDVTCDGWAIELKTTNTSYRYQNVVKKTRTITTNVQGIIDDIKKLKTSSKLTGTQKAVMFVVFPVSHENPYWQKHLGKIEKCLENKTEHQAFTFGNDIPGAIYLGQVVSNNKTST